ncbi:MULTISPECIES: MFS transporter [Acinetobacter]|uniref:MFS transporter n=1 Tax=Acinetobacter TaxID=469 RepID=UPI00044C0DAC|nr:MULTISPECIES: MFS transporter [Acinetobacter]EXD35340.1 major Facilitator Superfamily protein [Acinetobacter sp. 479375]MCU4523546.1 MFS transporter [Acinetobacter ursingii]MCU4587615.1 MFS transporter [Acinetobacter ursingii]RSO82217.1 MFS transporter [Acinetobacter ursingii]
MQHTSDISQNKALLWLMAIACGLCAGANYYCQPLIHSIQADFGVPEAQAALTVTFAQVSYALGLLFIVPLGDVVNKTKFIPLLMFLAGIGLLLCGFAINLPMLWIGTVMTGLFSVAAQVLIPLATMAVKPEKIGEVVGFLMSGLLVGILLSTSLAGLLSNLFHWKVIYLLSAIFMFFTAYLLKGRLPYVMRFQLNYAQIFNSMRHLLFEEKRLILRALVGACAFASMSTLFSTMALLLSSPPFHLKDFMIGIVSLIGVFGALSTSYAGKLADRGYTLILTWAGCGLLLMSWTSFFFAKVSLMFYVIGFGLINWGLALIHTSNQNIIFNLRPDAKSRLNAIYMTLYFAGAASGSAIGIFAWRHGGWVMTCSAGLALTLIAALFALIDRIYFHQKKQLV